MHQKISQSAQINIQTDCNLVFATKCQHQCIFEPIRIKVIGNWQQQNSPNSIFFYFFQFLFLSCYSEKVSEKSLEAYNACRLIPLNKNPGVRPISVREVIRRIIGKCIKRIENDLRFLGGNTHICPGQKCGIEHAIQSLRSQYDKSENEPVLLVDEKTPSTVSTVTWQLKISRTCPALRFIVQNSYSAPSPVGFICRR